MLIVADILILAGAVVAARLARAKPARAVPLVAAAAATVLFVVIRDAYELEDSPFLLALAAVCVGAFVTALSISAGLRQSLRCAATYGVVAGALVPALLVAYYAARLTHLLAVD
jgi:hypothetical protein